jgi:type IV pilus assembly protein PilC
MPIRINLLGRTPGRTKASALGYERFGPPQRRAAPDRDASAPLHSKPASERTVNAVITFTKQFSVMLDAGLPLVQCLEMLGRGHTNRTLGNAILEVKREVEFGATLAASMRKHPRIWEPMYTTMVEAGEIGGILDVILQRLYRELERDSRLSRAVRSALIYPAGAVLILAILTGLMLWLFASSLARTPRRAQVDLPLLTDVLLETGALVGGYGLPFLLLLVITATAARFLYQSRRGGRTLDRLLLAVPGLGPLLVKASVIRFAHSLSTMVSSGVPILECLSIAAWRSGNAVIREAILIVQQAVMEGRTIVSGLEESKVFPPMVTQMIGVGEQTGALDTMLAKIGNFYEEELETRLRDLSGTVRLLIIIVFGAMGLSIAMGVVMGIIALTAH